MAAQPVQEYLLAASAYYYSEDADRRRSRNLAAKPRVIAPLRLVWGARCVEAARRKTRSDVSSYILLLALD